MASNTREKMALLVFALLILFGLAGVSWYLIVGHSWNVAASNIDDSVGQMDGYTCIVYSGTTAQQATSSSLRQSIASAIGSDAGSSDTGSARRGNQSAASVSSAVGSVDANKSAAQGQTSDIDAVAAPVSIPQEAGASAERAESNNSTDAPAVMDSADAETEGSSASDESALAASDGQVTSEGEYTTSALKSFTRESSIAVSTEDVANSYADKNSSVLTLDTLTPGAYSEGTIVKRGAKRIGILSVDVPLSAEAAELALEPFCAAKVDMLICVTPSKSYVSNATGFDIVVTTQDDSVSTMGETSSKTFYVAAPTRGKVGAVVVSPSNTVSAKVIDSL